MQSTVVEHKDGGTSGGIFKSYTILKVGAPLYSIAGLEMKLHSLVSTSIVKNALTQVNLSAIINSAHLVSYGLVLSLPRVINCSLTRNITSQV